MFDQYIGIDYSGARSSRSRSPTLQVYAAAPGQIVPRLVRSPASTDERPRNWCRQEIAQQLQELAGSSTRFIAGIDHGFSFPIEYFRRYDLSSWDEFLEDFVEYWPTDQAEVTVDDTRAQAGGPQRVGASTQLRLTERWSSSAKSVFQFDVQGSVAKSTHAGLPWLWRIRQAFPDQVHFWPFDGWKVPGEKSVIAEVFPSVFRNRFPRESRTVDQQDAYGIARWLAESDQHDILPCYFAPPLTADQREVANLEGWILGIW